MTEADGTLLSELPPLLAEVAELAGIKAALELSHHFGGIKVYVPKEPRESDNLSRAIGLVAARALSRRFAGDELEVPRFARKKVHQILAATGNNAEIARRLDCTKRYVRMVRNGHVGGGRDDRQLSFLDED